MSGKTINCVQCHCEFYRQLHEINPTNNFCSYSCAAVYANSHKTHGNRRSKLEIWIEHELKKLYPCLEFQFNKTAAINAELDIYVPSLNLAFELNGIFHYEPIFSEEKLNDVQNNDRRKFQLCLDKKIELCVINTSDQNRFSPKTSGIYLSIIKTIINEKMGWLTNPDIATQVSQT
jgi:hypothetical protein